MLVAPSLVLFLAMLASQAAVVVLAPILVEVSRAFDVSPAATGQLRTLTGLVAGVAALAFGRLGRGVALRDLLLLGSGLLALGAIGSAAAPSFAVFAAAQVPLGLAVALLVAAGAAAAADWAKPDERTRVLSWALVGPAVAWVVGMPLVGLVAERSWRLSFLVLPLAASLIVAWSLSLCRKEQLPAVRPLVRLRDLLGERVVGTWALAELLSSSAWAGTLVYAGALFVESYGTSAALTGLILGVVAAAYLPGNFLAARTVRGSSTLFLLAPLSLLGAAGVAVLGAVREGTMVSAALLAALVFVMAARTFAAGAYGLEIAPDRRLAIMGIRAAALQFGYLVGSAAGGLALLLSGYTGLGAVYAALFAAAAVCYLALQRLPSAVAATR